MLIIVLFTYALSFVSGQEKLLMVHAVWRHGDRAPLLPLTRIGYNESDWPNGLGELTSMGMAQMFNLGKLMRNQVMGNFSTLHPNEVYVRSTDFNRTLTSAMCAMAGVFPDGRPGIDFPFGMEEWPGNWSPIPIHTTEFDSDHISNPLAECHRVRELNGELIESTFYKQFLAKNEDLFNFLSNETGMSVRNAYLGFQVADFFKVQLYHNRSLPAWATPKMLERLKDISYRNFLDLFGLTDPRSIEKTRITGGFLLKTIVDQMRLKISCMKAKRVNSSECVWINRLKFYGVQGHDTTLWALLGALGSAETVYKEDLPGYSAAVAIQLWDVPGIGPAVKVLHRHGFYDKEFHPITRLTTGCPSRTDICPIDFFHERSIPLMPVDIVGECKVKGRRKAKIRRIVRSDSVNRFSQLHMGDLTK